MANRLLSFESIMLIWHVSTITHVFILVLVHKLFCSSVSIIHTYCSQRKCLLFWQVMSIIMLSAYVPGSKTSILEEAFNRNLLSVFLLVNRISSYTHYVFPLRLKEIILLCTFSLRNRPIINLSF